MSKLQITLSVLLGVGMVGLASLAISLRGEVGVLNGTLTSLTDTLRSSIEQALTRTTVTRSLGGLTNYDELALNNAKAFSTIAMKIGSASSTAFSSINSDTYTKWITGVSLFTSGTATRTPYRIGIATTSAPTATSTQFAEGGISVPLYNESWYTGVLSFVDIASSTAATTTSWADPNNIAGNPTGRRLIAWKPNEYIGAVLQIDYPVDTASSTSNAASCPTHTGLGMCEAATSTARGFNVDILIDYIATSTQR